jgi:hypothetical protein
MEQRVRRCPDTMKQNSQELLCYLDHVFRASVLHDPGLGFLRIVINSSLPKCIFEVLLVRWIWQRLIRCWVMPEFNIDIKNILDKSTVYNLALSILVDLSNKPRNSKSKISKPPTSVKCNTKGIKV